MDRVGKVYYREVSNISNEAIMIINKLNNGIYYRDIWGINKYSDFNLYVNDDITIEELESVIVGNDEVIVIDINEAPKEIKQKAIVYLFRSEIEYRS